MLSLQDYHYRAIDLQNRIEHGVFKAQHVDDLERHLQRNHLILLDYRIKKPHHFNRRHCNPQERIEFCFYLTQLLRAGIPLIDSLQQLSTSLSHLYFRNIITHLVNSMESGECLSQSMREFPQVFDKVFINLIQVGEQSGQLPSVLQHLTDTLTWKQSISQSIKKTLIYPAFLFSLILLTLIFLLYWLVPQLLVFIQGLAVPIPWHTRILIHVSTWVQLYGFWLMLFFISTISGLIIAVRSNSHVHKLWDYFLLNAWGVGTIIRQLILARFSRFFALMYQSGLPILDVLDLLRGTLGNVIMEEGLAAARENIMAGDSISQGFAKTQLFSDLTLTMLAVGETTGNLDQALYHVSDFYQQKSQYQLEKFHALLEPSLTVFLAVILGGLMLSVLQPIYDLIGTMGLG